MKERAPCRILPGDWPPAGEAFRAQAWIAEVDPQHMALLYRPMLEPRAGDPPSARDDAEEALRRRADPFEVMNICCRLKALYCLMSDEDLGGWLIRRERGITFVRDSGAFVRAASRAPLRQVFDLEPYWFDPEPFLAVVLEEAVIAGRG